jgi:hypothetical protein
MADIQVSCIKRADRHNPHERITDVGGIIGETHWRKTQQQVIADLDSNTDRYWVQVGGKPEWVVAATNHYGYKFIKTESDGEDQKNLLILPECPV